MTVIRNTCADKLNILANHNSSYYLDNHRKSRKSHEIDYKKSLLMTACCSNMHAYSTKNPWKVSSRIWCAFINHDGHTSDFVVVSNDVNEIHHFRIFEEPWTFTLHILCGTMWFLSGFLTGWTAMLKKVLLVVNITITFGWNRF